MAELRYLRDEKDVCEPEMHHVTIYLVEAGAVAQPDEAAAASTAQARTAIDRYKAAASELQEAAQAAALAQQARCFSSLLAKLRDQARGSFCSSRSRSRSADQHVVDLSLWPRWHSTCALWL